MISKNLFPNPLKVCLFDLDGTLADSMGGLYGGYKAFLSKHHKKGSREEFEALNGIPLLQILHILNERHGLGLNEEGVLEEYRSLLQKIYLSGPLLFSGAKEWIAYLDEQGVAMGIVTAASRAYTEAFIRQHQLESFVTKITTAEDVGVGKPNPAIYTRALEDFGVLPSEAVAIEDSISGITASSEAGIYTFWIFSNAPTHDHPSVTPVKDWEDLAIQFKNLIDTC